MTPEPVVSGKSPSKGSAKAAKLDAAPPSRTSRKLPAPLLVSILPSLPRTSPGKPVRRLGRDAGILGNGKGGFEAEAEGT